MANRILNTRIKLRYDSYQNWYDKNPELLAGELAVAYIESGDTQEVNSVVAPQILFKVGPGAFNDLPWASGRAADVYSWAKQSGLFASTEATNSTSGDKTYIGNAITSVEWDSTLNGNKGGLKFVKGTQFATKAELDAALAAFDGEIGSITDSDTRYSFEIPTSGDNKGKLAITATKYVNGSAEGKGTTTYYDFVTPEELAAALADYYTKDEVDVLIQGVRDDIPTELGVMDVDGENAIEVTGDANKVVKLKINSNQGNVILDNSSDGLRANINLSTLVPNIKVNNAGHADSADSATNASKLGGQEPSYYAVDTLVVHTSEKGSVNGVATLDANGKVPTSQLPSYVDDVVEGHYNVETGKFYTDTTEVTEIIAETGKIYVETNTNKTYRWSGTQYVEISASLALGETSSTAYAGDKGKTLAEKVARIENVVQWLGDQPQIIGDVDSGLIIDGKADLYLNTAGVMRAEADSNIELNSENITVTAKAVEIGSANGRVLIKNDLKVDSSIQVKEPTTGTYGNLAKYNSGVLEIGSTTGAGTRIKGANANGVVIDSDVVQLGSTAVFKANPNKIVEVGRTDYTLQFKGSAAPTWTDGTNTKTVAMTDALNSYLPLSGGTVENLTVDDTLEVDYIKLGAVRGEYTLNIHTTGDRVVVDVPVDDSTEEKELAYRADIPTNVVQYYESSDNQPQGDDYVVFYCGSSSKLV